MNNRSLTWEIDVVKIGTTIWRQRVIFILTVAAVILLTIVFLHIAPKSYEVSMGIAPVQQNNQQVGGGLSALARLGGIDVSDLAGGTGQFRLFVSSLHSPDVAEELARDQNLMREMFPKQWSDSEHNWKEPQGVVHVVAHGIENLLGIPVRPWAPPSGEDVSELLTSDLEVDDDPKSPVVTLRMQSTDPQVVVDLMQKLAKSIDAKLREHALNRANSYIEYLKHELDSVTVADYRAVLVTRLSEQEQTRMMASANVSFSAQIFSGPTASTRPSSPKGVLILIAAFVVGGFLGGFLAVRAESRGWKLSWLPTRVPKTIA